MTDAILRVTGDLTIANDNASTHWLEQLPLSGPTVCVDLAGAGKIDSCAVAMLVRLHRRAQVNDVSLTVRNASLQLTKLLRFYGLADIIQSEPSGN